MFYQKLRKLLDDNEDTPSHLAESIGIAKSTITMWKCGIEPNLRTVVKICDHYNIPLDYFREV